MIEMCDGGRAQGQKLKRKSQMKETVSYRQAYNIRFAKYFLLGGMFYLIIKFGLPLPKQPIPLESALSLAFMMFMFFPFIVSIYIWLVPNVVSSEEGLSISPIFNFSKKLKWKDITEIRPIKLRFVFRSKHPKTYMVVESNDLGCYYAIIASVYDNGRGRRFLLSRNEKGYEDLLKHFSVYCPHALSDELLEDIEVEK